MPLRKSVQLLLRGSSAYPPLCFLSSQGHWIHLLPQRINGSDALLAGPAFGGFSGDPDHVRPEQDEIDFLTQELRGRFGLLKRHPLTRYAGWAGVQAATAARGWTFNEGVGEIASFDLETFLHAAAAVVSQCLNLLNRPAASSAVRRPLPGAPRSPLDEELLHSGETQLAAQWRIEKDTARYLLDTYGLISVELLRFMKQNPGHQLRLDDEAPALQIQALWSAQKEGIAHLTDFYLRRTRLGLTLRPDHNGAGRVAEIIGRQLWWTREKEEQELAQLRRVIAGEYR